VSLLAFLGALAGTFVLIYSKTAPKGQLKDAELGRRRTSKQARRRHALARRKPEEAPQPSEETPKPQGGVQDVQPEAVEPEGVENPFRVTGGSWDDRMEVDDNDAPIPIEGEPEGDGTEEE